MKDYQLIRIGSVWHLTQQQARPPARAGLACHTSCGRWAEMKDGYERGRPDCPTCMSHVERFEQGMVSEAVAEVNKVMKGPVSLLERIRLYEDALAMARRRRLAALCP